MIRDYNFQEQLIMSTGISVDHNLTELLLNNIPGAIAIEKAQLADDRNGTDYWVYRDKNNPLSIDIKARNIDPISRYKQDDLALELISVVENNKIGWTLDKYKQSDYILWLFKPTGRWVLIPFPMLCSVFIEHKELWTSLYRVERQSSDNGKWHSECVFVPRNVIWQSIYDRYSGSGKCEVNERK